MPFSLSNLTSQYGSVKRPARRLGRGHGTGRGKTAGRGTKGQKARTGGRRGLKRLGMKRILLAQPKLRGFQSMHPKPDTVNCGTLDATFPVNTVITPKLLADRGLIRASRGVKLLSGGVVTKAFTMKGVGVSGPAKAKIEAVGGRVEA